ncbi:protease complex subunit PrcB family protein [Dethiothermospora halolimnae]|uniref:protease complex subunit PrcB family protein n=1 Tax=Dethiothermospora halolimnae TaxID=3114390 RepID=UPI003CCC1368
MKRPWILAIIVIVVLCIIFIPKLISNEGDAQVKFSAVDKNDIPKKLKEALPNYLQQERALACRMNEDIYVVVTRGEKNTGGYSVTIDKIEKVSKDDDFGLIVYAKYKDPKPDEVVPQVITYPYTVVKTNLKELPKNIKLEVEYNQPK